MENLTVTAIKKVASILHEDTAIVTNKAGEILEVLPQARKPTGIRTHLLNAYNKGAAVYYLAWMQREERSEQPEMKVRDLAALLGYGAFHSPNPRGKRRKELVDIDGMVKLWTDVVVGLALAHDRDDRDTFESRIDSLLTPILTAPVKQLREFYTKLVAALKEDKRVPWIIWEMFEYYGEETISKAPDEGIKHLKTKLAQSIVDMSEAEIKPQIGDAIVNALRWRDPEQLQEIKKKLEAGEKPKLRGKESCLFFEVGEGDKAVSVML